MFSDLPPRLENPMAAWLYISSLTINSFIREFKMAVDKTRNMEHSGTCRNIPEHEKFFKILKK